MNENSYSLNELYSKVAALSISKLAGLLLCLAYCFPMFARTMFSERLMYATMLSLVNSFLEDSDSARFLTYKYLKGEHNENSEAY